MKTRKTALTNAQTSWSHPEEQTLYLKEHKRDEVQLIGKSYYYFKLVQYFITRWQKNS